MASRATHIVLLLVLATGILASLPMAQAGTLADTTTHREYLENYDTLPIGSVPCTPPPAGEPSCFYTITTSGSVAQLVNTAPAGLSGRSWQMTSAASASSGFQMANDGLGVNLCTSGQTLMFSGHVPDLPATDQWEFRVVGAAISTAAAPANSLGIRFTGTAGSSNNVNFFIRGNGGAVQLSGTGTMVAGVYGLTISQVNCSGTASATFSVTGVTSLTAATLLAAASDPISVTLARVAAISTGGATASATTVHLDAYDWAQTPLPAPVFTSIAPTGGHTSGGTSVTITGTGFKAGATVTIGGTAATNVEVPSGTSVTATTPAGTSGAKNVVVTNPDGQTATGTNAFTYGTADQDGDTVLDGSDNCVSVVNPAQLDQDGDGQGNDCDTDRDGDGLPNTAETAYAGTADRDADDYSDGTSVPANNPAEGEAGHLEPADNCPDAANPTQTDTNGDGVGDACQSGAAYAYTESFDNDIAGSEPSEPWYDYGGSFAGPYAPVSNAQSYSSPNSLDVTGAANVAAFFPSLDMCDDFEFEVAFRLSAFPSAATGTQIGLWNSAIATDAFIGLIVESGGSAAFRARSPGASQDVRSGLFTLELNKWYHLAGSAITCSPLAGTFMVREISVNPQSVTAPAGTSAAVLDMFAQGAESSAGADTGGWYLDDLRADGTTIIVVEATANVPGLVAFKVDVQGQNVLIARHDNPGGAATGGATVSTYNPGTLALLGTEETDCEAVPGIDAMPTHVTYTLCDPADDVDRIHVRDTFMGDANLGDCHWCYDSLDDDGAFGNNVPDNVNRLATISEYPYSFCVDGSAGCRGEFTPSAFAVDNWVVAFPFTETATGFFGVYAVQFRNNANDQDTQAFRRFSADGTTVSSLCSWRSSVTERDYIGVAQASVGVSIFTMDIEPGTSTPPSVAIQPYRSAPTFLHTAEAMACANNLVMASTADGDVGAYWVDTEPGHVAGQAAWQRPATTVLNGVTLSAGTVNSAFCSCMTQFGAYVDGDEIVIVYAGNGTIVDAIARPAGTVKGLFMDRPANNLWIGVGDNIHRYPIWPVTTGNNTIDSNPDPFSPTPSTPTPGPDATVGPGSTGGNLFRPANAVLPAGFTAATFDFMIGILLTLAIAGGAYFVLGQTMVGAAVGAAGGFFLAFAFGLIPVWVILLLALAVAALFVARHKGIGA